MDEKGIENLMIAMIQNAVDEYCHAYMVIHKMRKNPDKFIAQIKKVRTWGKYGKSISTREAQKIFDEDIKKQKTIMNQSVYFFNSDWYLMLCTIEPTVIIKLMEQKAVDRAKEYDKRKKKKKV